MDDRPPGLDSVQIRKPKGKLHPAKEINSIRKFLLKNRLKIGKFTSRYLMAV
jgi:hypothetical protein